WVWISPTSLVRTNDTITAMSVVGSNWNPVISVTTSVEPSGVLVTPVFAAAMNAATMITSLASGTAPCNARARHAPMKNRGMMKPPRHSADSVTDVPASLASAASAKNATVPPCLERISLICASPKVSEYVDNRPRAARSRPPVTGLSIGGSRRAPQRSTVVVYVKRTATSAPPTPATTAQPRSPPWMAAGAGRFQTGSRPAPVDPTYTQY